ncbi:MAG: amino acid ABC transporter permease [Leptolyngbyaceae bacterium]|nr:amino acid ABC transporter permease [Leptolyngbyaceae bacterium]
MTTAPQHAPSQAPPKTVPLAPLEWLQKNLFSSWFNTILTFVVVGVLYLVISGFLSWAFTTAQWAVIPNNIGLLMTGLYPREAYWRVWTILGMIVLLGGLTWGILGRNIANLFGKGTLIALAVICAVFVVFPLTRGSSPILIGMVLLNVAMAWVGQQAARKYQGLGQWISIAWFISYFVVLWLIGGGLGLEAVRTDKWGGLVLTLLMAVTGIALCFPIGVALALGRRSELPVVRWLSIAYIELIRGIPLIAILFMGQVMIPLFLPEGARPDRIIRAVIALTMFSSAYLAENVRAGLQAVPRGQNEASVSLGLNKPLTLIFIILPQALKTAIPAIVGQFISLFQDTTLLATLGLIELLGMANSVLANPNYLGRYSEVYLFVGVIYWFFCYALSLGSRQVEKQLNTGR